jgi:hypothetical protein
MRFLMPAGQRSRIRGFARRHRSRQCTCARPLFIQIGSSCWDPRTTSDSPNVSHASDRSPWLTSPTRQTLHSVSTSLAPATTSTFPLPVVKVPASGAGDHRDTRSPDHACQPGRESPAPQRLLTPQQSASQNESNDKVPRAVVAWRFPKTSTVLLASNAVSCRMLLESATYGGYDSDRSAATST